MISCFYFCLSCLQLFHVNCIIVRTAGNYIVNLLVVNINVIRGKARAIIDRQACLVDSRIAHHNGTGISQI